MGRWANRQVGRSADRRPWKLQPSPLGRGCPRTALSSAVVGRVRGSFQTPLDNQIQNSKNKTIYNSRLLNCQTICHDLCHLPFELFLILHSDTGSNPSPVALRLKKTPAARHPLPKGEGLRIIGATVIQY